MSYKTILVHADRSRHAAVRYEFGANLALAFDAHLVGAAMTGVSRFLPPESIEGAGQVIADHIDRMRSDARSALDDFGSIVGRIGVASYEQRLVNDDADGGMVLQARYADLALVTQFDPESTSLGQWEDLPEYLFLNAARPVLVLPCRSDATSAGQHALVCWDTSPEATRALTQALPLLKKTRQVTVLVIDAVHCGEHGPEPGADIALNLARHGIQVEVLQLESLHGVGSAILAQADRLQADLIVMGGYGHTRFRELLVGGATRTVLSEMRVPVLFAH